VPERALAPWQAMQPTPATLAGQQRLEVSLPPKAPLVVPVLPVLPVLPVPVVPMLLVVLMLLVVPMLLQVLTTLPTRKAKVVLLRVAVTGRT